MLGGEENEEQDGGRRESCVVQVMATSKLDMPLDFTKGCLDFIVKSESYKSDEKMQTAGNFF